SSFGMSAWVVRSPTCPRSSPRPISTSLWQAFLSAGLNIPSNLDSLIEELDRVSEQKHAITFLGQSLPCPPRMLGGQNVSVGMGHQSQYTAGGIANAGHVSLRAIGIDGVGTWFPLEIDIPQNYLSSLLQAAENPGLAA